MEKALEVAGCPTAVREVKGESEEVRVYPNPNNGVFTVSSSNSELVSGSQTIEVYNEFGEKVLTEILRSAQDDKVIDLRGQPNGVYFYRVLGEAGNLVGEGKFVIEK